MLLIRLGVSALAVACLVALFLVVLSGTSNGRTSLDYDNDWLLEDLSCEELISGYNFSMPRLTDLVLSHGKCQDYYASPAGPAHGELHCALIKKEGVFLQGLINDIAAVFNIKCADK